VNSLENLPLTVRLLCSLLAVGLAWFVDAACKVAASASYFYRTGSFFGDPLSMGLRMEREWLFWTGFMCFIGWLTVGLCIVALGVRAMEPPIWVTCPLAGIAGAGLMLVLLIVMDGRENVIAQPSLMISVPAPAMYGYGFFIAGMSMAFYKLLVWAIGRYES